MVYKVTRVVGGYVMTKENSDTSVFESVSSLKDLRANDKKKIVAVSESLYSKALGADIYLMRDEDCNALVGIKPRRPLTEITNQFKSAEPNSTKEFTGIMLVLRQEMYDYLSGKLSHSEFIRVYRNYEAFLGERGVTHVNGIPPNDMEKSPFKDRPFNNGWMPDDENNDDEYYNDDLEADKLNRDINMKLEVMVRVHQWQDEGNYVVMFVA
jgi:hypothetical protein